MNIEEMLQKQESSTLEFKENVRSDDKILATIIAFANSSGGKIIIGVNDKTHYVVGVDVPHKVCEILASKIHDSIEPRILPNIEVLPFRNTHLVCIEIYPSSLRPHFLRSKGQEKSTYIRIGSTTRLADKDLLRIIERSVLPKSFDEELCYEANYEAIDFTAAAQLFAHKRLLVKEDLLSLGLIVKNGEDLIPTIAGILLFGVNRFQFFPDAWIQVGIFDGVTKDRIVASQKITSLLPNAVDEVMNFIKQHIKVGINIDDIKHQEFWERPKIALREAIINAIVHTDYSLKGSPIRVALFDDRIEIENSALLPWGLSFDDLKTGVSKLRNPTIGRVFNEIGLIEQWGSGIRRMINECLSAGIGAPTFEEIGPRIRITFYRAKVSNATFDDIDQKIITLLVFCGPLSTHQITNCIGRGKRSTINKIAKLVDQGQLIEIATSPNDPKKKYALKAKRATNKSDLIDVFWDSGALSQKLLVRFKNFGKDCLDLEFDRSVVAEYFINEGAEIGNELAAECVKKIIVSENIFIAIFQNALLTESVKDDFRNQRVAKYEIKPEHFNFMNYGLKTCKPKL